MAARRRNRWGFIVLGLVAVALVAWVLTHRKKAPPPGPPPVAVTTATVAVQDIPLTVSALGAAQAWNSATIRAQVSGMLLRVPVREGSDVRAGDLLAEIDPRPFQAALQQAQGALNRDQALLDVARVLLARDKQLLAQDSIARQDFDTQAALVKQDEGIVELDKGVVETAAINLKYCRITAPTDGRVGVRLVDPGNLVSSTDTTGVLILNQITPIAVTFTVPEGDFQRLASVSNRFHAPLAVQALSQETGEALGAGELSIADNRVDPTTGTVTLKARFANPSHQLWPGQFVNVQLVLQTLPRALTIPLAAVNRGPKGAFAYVVGANSKVSVRPVTVTTVEGATAIIQSGLKPGEVVVTDGQLILKPGMTVRARPSAPQPAAAPGGGVFK
ncbi:MAG: efflux transporter periplasmic adaptor subunit [Phenylobacterium sp.]|nr:efflux transporter periplasmic adaptor subunit [Phenylobacterium sp.]